MMNHEWKSEQDERWAINIDIEGFSDLWEAGENILKALHDLMQGIFRIATYCFPGNVDENEADRLFVHQLGDGFWIISNFGEESLERPITIAAVLMQYVASGGFFTRAGISEGTNADITGCYPAEVLNARKNTNTILLGCGLMTIFTVMGTAAIRSLKVAKIEAKGPIMIVKSSIAHRIPDHIPVQKINDDYVSVNWIHMESNLMEQIKSKTDLDIKDAQSLENILINYCNDYPDLPKEWEENAKRFLISENGDVNPDS